MTIEIMKESIKDKKFADEKPNIVVWLDFDAYAYTNFGIMLALSLIHI